MEQPFSTSKVTVEYFDPHDVFKLLAPGLVPRLPLRNLHWQSHAGPLRSIDTLHIELVSTGDKTKTTVSSLTSPLSSPPPSQQLDSSIASRDDGFQTQIGATSSSDQVDQTAASRNSNSTQPARRHQIPGLRRTPYLKVLLVRCDDNDSYKGHVRQEVRDWIKANTPPSGSKRNTAENHDAFEWLIVHVVIPNTVAATQPRDSGSVSEKSSTASRWRPGSSTLLEKMRSDFNTSSKGAVDRIAQIRIGVNDVPYDSLPRVVPAVPSGYTETEQETENSWLDLVSKFRSLILSSFDLRVSQYEEDIREKDAQRTLPGWNFCTFFILKEGLARGFESVGLVEDALVGYDELSVGLDMIVEDLATTGSSSAANALLSYTDELKQIALKARSAIAGAEYDDDGDDDEVVDLQSSQVEAAQPKDAYDDIPISSTKKPYRDMIVANNVSVFDFRCYIFARQIALLLRLGNAWSTREELLAKLKEQQESVLHGVAPRAPPPKQKENEHEDLTMLAEICRRTLEFIPTLSQVMRNDVLAAMVEMAKADGDDAVAAIQADPLVAEVVDNLVASVAFSIAQQILAQTSTKALPIPETTLASPDSHEPKSTIPEPKTMMHPARTSSLAIRTGGTANVGRPPPSPNVFPGRQDQGPPSPFLKAGLEELAARRAELYIVSRNILAECGKKRGWSDGWASVPVIGESTMVEMVEIDLGDDKKPPAEDEKVSAGREAVVSISGIDSKLLNTALDNSEDFYRLYETLTDKALRHFTVADHTHSVQTSMADIAVLKYHLGEYGPASFYFWRTTPFFGESGWSLLELSMLVMYSRCLEQLQRKEEYVKVMLKLLTKAAAAERDRLEQKLAFRLRKSDDDVDYPDDEAIKGFLDNLLAAANTLPNEMQIPLSSFFSLVQAEGPPEYHQGRDSISLNLRMNSLLVDDLKIDAARVRVVSTAGKPSKEIWFELAEPTTLKPGKNRLKLNSNSAIPGSYEIDKIDLTASNLRLFLEREVSQPPNKASDTLQSPYVVIYHRADTLDVRLHASKHIQLDRNNTVDIELDPGWNDLKSAEVRVKAATGGLRLLTSEAKCIGSSVELSKPPEGGLFCFDAIEQNEPVRVRFPFTVEQETPSISVRIDVTYTTEHGTFFFSKTPSIETSLALGVNVQDVFKHKALFSRFTVSTASQSPLRLFKSELLASEVFESDFGVPPSAPVVVFPRQPASLLYKITRKRGVKITPKTQKTLYLRLRYSVLQDEIESLIESSLTRSLQDKPLLRPFSRLLCATVAPHVRHGLPGHELERAALLGSVPTTFLASVHWAKHFAGLGRAPDNGGDYAQALAAFLRTWQKDHRSLALALDSPAEESRSILIPVDVPSLTIVHTADIRLQPATSPPAARGGAVCTNQLVPAALQLKWTRVWDTTTTTTTARADLEFSYEIHAPQDTWLVGGRRKGHFVIPSAPAPASGSARKEGRQEKDDDDDDDDDDDAAWARLGSTPATEAEIPLLLIPLREGWLPYPSVEVREVRAPPDDGGSGSGVSSPAPAAAAAAGGGGGGGGGAGAPVSFETDFRNLGETVRVVGDRARVTLSLDASGPGGGPLVLDVERRGLGLGLGSTIA